ncbi:MAG TPA: hypothetical protein VI875_03900 [Candidatus Norongarragalinales archaeon]|nr:hypothetical protein [Candidatus Norongarragalinales archaeon]
MRLRKSVQQPLQIAVREVLLWVAELFSHARHIFLEQYPHS